MYLFSRSSSSFTRVLLILHFSRNEMQARKLRKMKECVITRLLVLSFNRYQHPIFINSHLMRTCNSKKVENRTSRLLSHSDRHLRLCGDCLCVFERETAKLYNNFGSEGEVKCEVGGGGHVLYFKLISMTRRSSPQKRYFSLGMWAYLPNFKTGRKIAHNQSSPGWKKALVLMGLRRQRKKNFQKPQKANSVLYSREAIPETGNLTVWWTSFCSFYGYRFTKWL
jgi:hypothetical protein